MRYISITCTTTNDVDIVQENFVEFYNLVISNHVPKSRAIQFYPDITYFLVSWSD
jgi:hypothetical protein